MTSTKLYISGPMTGIPEYNFPAFNEAAALLHAVGYDDVENPADFGVQEGWTWADYLRRDIAIVARCDGIALLPDWLTSKGARLEVHNALELGMPVRTVAEWVAIAKAAAR